MMEECRDGDQAACDEAEEVIKDQVEEEAKLQLKSKDVILQWLVRWCAMLLSRYLPGKDGKTACERRHGRKCNIPTERFAEKVWYKELKTKAENKGKLETNDEGQLDAGEVLLGARCELAEARGQRRQLAPVDPALS